MFEKKVFLLFAIATAIAGLAVGCSCEEPPPKPAPAPAKPPPAAPPAPAPKMVVPTVIEEMKNQIEIPSDYPEDGLVYPGAHAATTTRHKGKLSVMFSTTDPAEDVVAYTTDFLDEAGWENVTREDLPNGTYFKGDKDDGRTIGVLISDLPDAPADVETNTLIVVALDP